MRGLIKRLLGKLSGGPTPDNSDRACHALDQRSEGELTLVGTCSLCGARIELWPCRQDRCERCLARVEHV